MKVMMNYTLHSLGANKVRTAVTVAGVALAAALLVAVLASFTSAMDFLERCEVHSNGTWMAEARFTPDRQTVEDENRAEEDPAVAGWARLQDVGFARLDQGWQERAGMYLTLLEGAGDLRTVAGVRVDEGRLPQKAGEILLPRLWRDTAGVALGDEVSFDVGWRQAVAVEEAGAGAEGALDGRSSADGAEADSSLEQGMADGTLLDSTYGYFDAQTDGGRFNEELVDVAPRSYTVVGFYPPDVCQLYAGTGYAALTCEDGGSVGSVAFLVDLADAATRDQVIQTVQDLFPTAQVDVHANLLRYRGITDDRQIWHTFFGLVVVLAAVIMAACVSLIYNAFAISVNERIRQFGLLASIGASRRQLSRSVFLEAALIAAAGVPLGIALGCGGAAVVFALLGPGISEVLGNAQVPFVLVVRPWVLVFAALLAVLTVLASVWVPAFRAARVTPVQALRQMGTGSVAARAARDARRSALGRPWAHKGVAGRVFGIGGQLASINHRRNAAKGRAASVSLAVAMVLMMTAGSLTTQLSTLVQAAGSMSESDVELRAMFSADADEDSAAIEQACTQTIAACSQVEGIQMQGWSVVSNRLAVIPRAMTGETSEEGNGSLGVEVPGARIQSVNLVYVEPAAFSAYAKENGVALPDDGSPCAIGLSGGYDNNGSVYRYEEFFRAAGMVQIVDGAQIEGRRVPNVGMAEDGKTGEVQLWTQLDGASEGMAVSPSQLNCIQVEVAGLAPTAPLGAGAFHSATLVLPLTATSTVPFNGASLQLIGAFDAVDHERAATELGRVAGLQLGQHGFDSFYCNAHDYVDEEESMRILVTVVNAFCLLFSLILTLIALANVFNTLTNGLMLRRREFAVMESVGMDGGEFRRMIVSECAGYGIRGLVPGVLVSLVVSYGLYWAIALSVRGVAYQVPWGALLLSFGLMAVVVGLSVAYGIGRTRHQNVAEALRME